jgi:hypothetical protein
MLTLKKLMTIKDRFELVVDSAIYARMMNGVVALQIALMVLSLLYINSVLFFISLKSLLVLSIFRFILERKNKNIYSPLDWLVVLPGVWAAILGLYNGNIGVKNELAVFVMAPIAYLFIFFKPSPSFFKHAELVFKVIAAFNLMVFFFLYFTEGGSLHTLLKDATLFLIQYPEGYIKVYSLQVTPLIFLLPVLAGYYYFRQTFVNFVLITAAILMALLSGRKAVLLLFIALVVFGWLYHLYRNRDLKASLKLTLPCIFALLIFPQIASFDNSKFSSVLFGSFSSPVGLAPKGEIGALNKFNANERADFSYLYNSPSNVCALEGYLSSGVDPNKLGPAVRSAQMNMLIKEISVSPFFGRGIGYIISECIRSEQQPWRFELSYLGMTLNIGIVGMIFFVLLYLRWVKIALLGSISHQIAVPLLCGSIFFVICSATNPYILSVEYLWIYFIPFQLSRLAIGKSFTDLPFSIKR